MAASWAEMRCGFVVKLSRTHLLLNACERFQEGFPWLG